MLLFSGLYYVYQRSYIVSTKDLAFFDNAKELQAAFPLKYFAETSPDKINIVYFWQANCPCDVTVSPHFHELFKHYDTEEVAFHVVDLSTASHQSNLPSGHLVDSHRVESLRPIIKFTPSVAIWDNRNVLTYYGPHSLGFVCNADTSFIKKVVDTLLHGKFSENTNTIGEGCFCPIKPLTD